MQEILNETVIFYKANNSQINGKKLILITINTPKNDSNSRVFIGPNKKALKKTEENEFIGYHGVWIDKKDHKKFIMKLLQCEIVQITQALNSKKTTDK